VRDASAKNVREVATVLPAVTSDGLCYIAVDSAEADGHFDRIKRRLWGYHRIRLLRYLSAEEDRVISHYVESFDECYRPLGIEDHGRVFV
jgi:hypothetical protein